MYSNIRDYTTLSRCGFVFRFTKINEFFNLKSIFDRVQLIIVSGKFMPFFVGNVCTYTYLTQHNIFYNYIFFENHLCR